MPRVISLTADPRPSRITRKSYRPRASDRTMVATGPPFCFAGFGTDGLRHEEAMKTADRETPNRWAALTLGNRAHGAAGPNRSCSFQWAAKQEKFQPWEMFSFLTSPYRTYRDLSL
jgi:hypothetical protein